MKPIKAVIDRIESDIAVLQTRKGRVFTMSADKLPVEAKAGDWLVIDGELITVDEAATQRARENIDRLIKDVWED